MKITEIRKLFKDAGIPASFFYLDTDDVAMDEDGEPMAIRIDLTYQRDKIEIYFRKETDIEIHVDKKKNQLVLNADEAAHNIVGWNFVSVPADADVAVPKKMSDFYYDDEFIAGEPTEDRAYMGLPGSTKYKVGEELEVSSDIRNYYGGVVRGWNENTPRVVRFYRVVASVPDVQHSFLMGFDDLEDQKKHPFVSMLPIRASSVAEAHEILKPKGLPEGTVRVAEFFFAPVSEKKSKELDAIVTTYGTRRINYSKYLSKEVCLDDSENHFADNVITIAKDKNIGYVIGWVFDNVNRHAPVFFADWHEVHRNLEVPTYGNSWD